MHASTVLDEPLALAPTVNVVREDSYEPSSTSGSSTTAWSAGHSGNVDDIWDDEESSGSLRRLKTHTTSTATST
eukprot:2842151-Amphidinium_carterae.1